jgi:hypothetical protein
MGRVFLGRAICPGRKIVAANFRNRISMQPTRRHVIYNLPNGAHQVNILMNKKRSKELMHA